MQNTPKHFALQLGSLISLYISVISLITLLFGLITLAIPDAAEGAWELRNAQSTARFSIAMLIVFFPTYIVLTRIVNTLRREAKVEYVAVTRWLVYLSLVIGGGALLGDLVSVVFTYLNGEITARFLYKALAFFVVAGGAFTYYLLDARDFWKSRERASIIYAVVTILVVLASLIAGFLSIESPQTVREQQIDQEQVYDLQNMSTRIYSYYDTYGVLPQTVEEAYNGANIPEAPEGREAYTYSVLKRDTFELCATFMTESNEEMVTYERSLIAEMPKAQTWDHGIGETCFERSVE